MALVAFGSYRWPKSKHIDMWAETMKSHFGIGNITFGNESMNTSNPNKTNSRHTHSHTYTHTPKNESSNKTKINQKKNGITRC